MRPSLLRLTRCSHGHADKASTCRDALICRESRRPSVSASLLPHLSPPSPHEAASLRGRGLRLFRRTGFIEPLQDARQRGAPRKVHRKLVRKWAAERLATRWGCPLHAFTGCCEYVEPKALSTGSEGDADHPLATVASDLDLAATVEDQKRIAERLGRPTPARGDPVASLVKPLQRGSDVVVGQGVDILPDTVHDEIMPKFSPSAIPPAGKSPNSGLGGSALIWFPSVKGAVSWPWRVRRRLSRSRSFVRWGAPP